MDSREVSELNSKTFDKENDGAAAIDTPYLKVMAVTWNLEGQMPTEESLDDLFQKDNVQHDMYILGTQEAIRSIAHSMFMPNKEPLNNMVLDYFADNLP